ncbi:MAG: hypothetical protein R6V41_06875 [Desulfobacteraceae bacterium]
MTRKVTLSIPDFLYEELKKWRPTLNLSGMFQETVAEAIQKKEEFQKRFQQDFDMPEIIKRLQQEKMESEKNYFDTGKAEGLKWAKTAHYEDLIKAVQHTNPKDLFHTPEMNEYFNKIFKSDKLMKFSYNQDRLGPYAKLFLEGWSKGILDFYNEIKEKL